MAIRRHTTLRRALILVSLAVVTAGALHPEAAAADPLIEHTEQAIEHAPLFWSELTAGFDAQLRILSRGTYQDPADSTQNPGNDFLRLPGLTGDLEIRPDVYLQFKQLDLSIKPRAYLRRSIRTDGPEEGRDNWKNDGYINEWRIRAGVTNSLFLSYGRENLQWGPSYLFSPSNPFFEDNGRMDPNMEVPGMGFATLVWIPSIQWTLSLIANTDEGRQEFAAGKFRKSYALKIDYTGNEAYTGLILSRGEKERERIGAFGGWTASDALLLYADIGFSRGSDALYPVKDDVSPFGVAMEPVDGESSKWRGSAMIGASHTFMAGPTVSMEYLYNGTGHSDGEAGDYYRLRREARNAYYESAPLGDCSRMVLGQTADPGMRFLRNRYLLLQYRQNDIRDVLNLSLSWIHNIDDKGGRWISTLEWAVGDHVRIFSIGSLNTGAGDSEFRTPLDSSLTLGVEYTF